MKYPGIYLMAILASQANALLATFDQKNINLQNYVSATYSGFSIASAEQGGIVPHSGQNFAQGTEAADSNLNATGTLRLNTHSSYGHLRNYYFACYTPQAFTPTGYDCKWTMTATCYNTNNRLQTFTRLGEYARDDNAMAFIDLTDFYSFYATKGYFTGNGSGAKCTRYDFTAVNAVKDSFPTGFYVDDLTYTVTA